MWVVICNVSWSKVLYAILICYGHYLLTLVYFHDWIEVRLYIENNVCFRQSNKSFLFTHTHITICKYLRYILWCDSFINPIKHMICFFSGIPRALVQREDTISFSRVTIPCDRGKMLKSLWFRVPRTVRNQIG